MAGGVLSVVKPERPGPVPPFVVNDHGDLHVVDSLEDPRVETFDALDFEYFDAEGKRLRATVTGRKVSLRLDTDAKPEPERLFGLIQTYIQSVAKRRKSRDPDDMLLEQVREATTLKDSIIALGRFITANESRTIVGRLMNRKQP
jgi:hypothetical protein